MNTGRRKGQPISCTFSSAPGACTSSKHSLVPDVELFILPVESGWQRFLLTMSSHLNLSPSLQPQDWQVSYHCLGPNLYSYSEAMLNGVKGKLLARRSHCLLSYPKSPWHQEPFRSDLDNVSGRSTVQPKVPSSTWLPYVHQEKNFPGVPHVFTEENK